MNLLSGYMRWLHTRWPAGYVEKLPAVNPDGSTAVPGLYVVGDIAGIPLLKFSSDTGARAVQTIINDTAFQKRDQNATRDGKKVLDLVVLGAGVSGVAAAIEARKHDLSFELLEASQPFSTIVNFPKGKPIFTYPTDMTPAGDLQFGEESAIKEGLVDELHRYLKKHDIQPLKLRAERITRKGGLLEVVIPDGENLLAHRVVVGIGRSGNFRKLGVPGEDLGKVSNRLHDPKDYCGKKVLIVGGGDTAMETAIALGACGSHVTVSYRKPQFSRPKPENIENLNALAAEPMAEDAVAEEPSGERVTAASALLNDHRKAGSVTLMMASKVKDIHENDVVITDTQGNDQTIENEAVFTMIGREAPLDFFRRSGVPIRGEWRAKTWASFAIVLAFFTFIYHWKKPGAGIPIGTYFKDHGLFPYKVPDWLNSLNSVFADPTHLLGTLNNSLNSPGFYYSLAYCVVMLVFGIRRIRRRKTPYVTVQTWTLVAVQWIPLFILPYILLPWMGHNGLFDNGALGWLADELFPRVTWDHNDRRAYYHAFGFILAWPLFVWNVFTDQPMWLWLAISFVQTFVIIPLMVWRWGKGAYCGWICSCGGMAETLGDAHRQKMPHGPMWNRLNMIGQFFLEVCLFLLATRILSWVFPGSVFASVYTAVLKGIPVFNYAWFIDLLFAGIIGFGFYFHLSGRVWCRFACPLAALMHIYARFSQFRILSDKKKCISCNVCTSVCHQGIDIMNFANKGLPMEDPQCVRCSACVQSCPTGVLSFGRIDRNSGDVLAVDRLGASPVWMAELTVNGKAV